jgi:hypothetical protein
MGNNLFFAICIEFMSEVVVIKPLCDRCFSYGRWSRLAAEEKSSGSGFSTYPTILGSNCGANFDASAVAFSQRTSTRTDICFSSVFT